MIATEILIIYRMIGMKNKYSIYIERWCLNIRTSKVSSTLLVNLESFSVTMGGLTVTLASDLRPSDLSVSRSSKVHIRGEDSLFRNCVG